MLTQPSSSGAFSRQLASRCTFFLQQQQMTAVEEVIAPSLRNRYNSRTLSKCNVMLKKTFRCLYPVYDKTPVRSLIPIIPPEIAASHIKRPSAFFGVLTP